MMEETETPHPDYVTGFNEGYTIAQHMPELADQLSQAIGDTDRGQGFKSGREQFLEEMKDNRRPSFLRSDRLSDLDKDTSKDIDKEDR